jgi:flagellar biosynthesis protein FliQ
MALVISLGCVVATLIVVAVVSAFYALTMLSGIALAQFMLAIALAIGTMYVLQRRAWPWMRRHLV